SNYLNLSQTSFAYINGGRYSSSSVGSKGEIGLLQILPSTASKYDADKDALKDVGTNVRVATQYLFDMKSKYNTDTRTALIIFNWGETNYRSYLRGNISIN